MKFSNILMVATFCGVSSLLSKEPEAMVILEAARMSAALTKMEEGLKGHLQHDGKKTPIHIFLNGKDIQFQFLQDQVWRVFHLRLNDNNYQLFEIIDNKTINFPREKLTESIAGSDLTYEDLALRFFYWPDPKLEGIETVGNHETFKLRLDKPASDAGKYHAVYLWVHTKYGAFMKINGHAKNGAILKEFLVEDVMKVSDETWTLRKMQVSSFQDGRRSSITDLVLDRPDKKALRGLR